MKKERERKRGLYITTTAYKQKVWIGGDPLRWVGCLWFLSSFLSDRNASRDTSLESSMPTKVSLRVDIPQFYCYARIMEKYVSDNLHSRCLRRLLLLLFSQVTLGYHLREWRDSSPGLNLGQKR